jgi:ElaB/YqjD/DUF883 family membrane-anchored ribosome-binding protein
MTADTTQESAGRARSGDAGAPGSTAGGSGSAFEQASEALRPAVERASETLRPAIDRASETLRPAIDRASETLRPAVNRASETLRNLGRTGEEWAKDAEGRAAEIGKGLRDQGERALGQLARRVEQNPLTSLTIAFALGFLCAALARR